MKTLRSSIGLSLSKYPEFDEVIVALELAEKRDLAPGVRLDATKSVYESIVKTMLNHLDKSKSKIQINRMPLVDAAKRLLEQMANRGEDIDFEFMDSMAEVIKRLSITRNQTGDVSHGHVAPKDNSTGHLADLMFGYVESSCVYLFEVFLEIDLSLETPLPYEDDLNSAFNDYLDSIKEPIGNVLYSQALYSLDYDAYVDEQDKYNNNLYN